MGEEYNEKVSPPVHIPFILPGELVGGVHSGQIVIEVRTGILYKGSDLVHGMYFPSKTEC
jgi:hypothetical protein